MYRGQDDLTEEGITALNRAVLALRAAHISVADIASIKSFDVA